MAPKKKSAKNLGRKALQQTKGGLNIAAPNVKLGLTDVVSEKSLTGGTINFEKTV
jgi:hypothetical protein